MVPWRLGCTYPTSLQCMGSFTLPFKGKSNKNEIIWILPNHIITHGHIVFSFYLEPLSIHAVKFSLATERFQHLAFIPSKIVRMSLGPIEQTNSLEQCYDDFILATQQLPNFKSNQKPTGPIMITLMHPKFKQIYFFSSQIGLFFTKVLNKQLNFGAGGKPNAIPPHVRIYFKKMAKSS